MQQRGRHFALALGTVVGVIGLVVSQPHASAESLEGEGETQTQCSPCELEVIGNQGWHTHTNVCCLPNNGCFTTPLTEMIGGPFPDTCPAAHAAC